MKSIFKIFFDSNNSFDGEESGEEVVLLLRRHPFVIIIKFVYFIFLALAPIVFANTFLPFLLSYSLVGLYFFIVSVWYTLLWFCIFYSLTMYTLDVWIVTGRRVIDSTQHGFFNRTISELHLERIQDISVETKGVIQTFLRFGDLHIQTAGTEERFIFLQVPDPAKVKDEIMRLISLPKSSHNL